jgi:hypothetical protein
LECDLHPDPQPRSFGAGELTVDRAIAACAGDMNAGRWIVANDFLKTEVSEGNVARRRIS